MSDERAASVAVDERAPISRSVRSEQVLVRLTPDEKRAVTAAAEARGMTAPDYLRLCFETAQHEEVRRGY